MMIMASRRPLAGGLLVLAAAIAGPAAAQEDDLFTADRVPRLHIRLSDRDAERLRQEPKRYVRCTLEEEGGATIRGVAVKLKGAAGSFREFDDRPALTVSLVKFSREGSFHGLGKFHLNNSVQDETYAVEWLAAGLCAEAGQPAARTAHARVRINDRDLGLYVLKEGFDERFLARHFPRADGNLYDGGFVQDLDGDLEKDCGDGPDDASDLAALVAACREPEPEARRAAIAERLDVDRFLTFVALELMLGHWDGYAGNVNNYRLYFDPADGRARFFPHGMDQVLGDPGAPILDRPRGLVAAAVMDDPQWRAAWRERVRELLPRFDPPEPLLERLAALERRLAPAVAELGPEAAEHHAGLVRELAARIRGRAESLREQSMAPEPEPVAEPEFDERGVMRLADWEPRAETPDAVLEAVAADDPAGDDPRTSYTIRTGPEGTCIASWRRRVRLEPGDYVLRAVATAHDVAPLADEKGRGAGVRISGAGRDNALEGTAAERELLHAFTIRDEAREVELVAELRATAGDVAFDAASFELRRTGAAAPDGDAP